MTNQIIVESVVFLETIYYKVLCRTTYSTGNRDLPIVETALASCSSDRIRSGIAPQLATCDCEIGVEPQSEQVPNRIKTKYYLKILVINIVAFISRRIDELLFIYFIKNTEKRIPLASM